jgi:hypothetical protein
MKQNFDFFKTNMPDSRNADFYLGCLDGSIFLDFNCSNENLIYLRRISFDGFGCCNIDNNAICLDSKLSKDFLDEICKDNLNQENITKIVLELIKLNRENIWLDALEEYQLVENE